MKTQTSPPGIPNYDPATGVHYGVISQNSLNPDAFSDIFNDARDLSYEAAKEELLDRIMGCDLEKSRRKRHANVVAVIEPIYYGDRQLEERKQVASEITVIMDSEKAKTVGIRDSIWNEINDRFNDQYQGDDHSWLWEKDGYKLMDCLDSDVFVILSPFYTRAPQCSPCVPNAGNLDGAYPSDDKVDDVGHGLKTYCLGHDFFDDGAAPYPVFSVKSGKRVVMVEKKVTCPTCEGKGRRTVEALAQLTGNPVATILKDAEDSPGYLPTLNLADNTFECGRCAGAGHTIEKVEEEQE